MQIGKPALWLGVVSAFLVIAFVWVDRGRVSPGPVHPAHARDARLAGEGCESCHGAPGEPMAQACASCHREVVDQIASRRGFHGSLEGDAGDCGSCHVEHHGDEVALVGERSFALAGFTAREAYDHRGLDFGLTGRHATLACRDCHPNADEELVPEGGHRFLGLAQACTACHEDVHEGRLEDCASCHGQEHPFEQVASFVHTADFRLAGAHAGLACADCHPKDGPHAIEAPRPEHRACLDCHESPHAERFLAAVAPGGACEDCHPTVHDGFGAGTAELTASQHAATGFALDAPHDRAACDACHPRDAESFAAAHPGRSADDCRSCHDDPHAGQFDRGPFAGTGCLGCHERHDFRPPTFDVALHARTAFALTGAHAAVPCASCHDASIPLAGEPNRTARRFSDTATECAGCHADAHQGFFDRPAVLGGVAPANGCAECHDTNSFSTASPAFAHAKSTGFALLGAHADLGCAACHAPAEHPDALGRTFGRASTPAPGASCRACHEDPHAGAFDRPGLPREVEGRDDCARCHTQEAFDPTRKPFDHALWTGFQLVGAHERLACENCHAPARPADAAKGRFAPARGTDCAACHADPHAGQFAKGGATDCARCHATSGPFRDVAFDHQRDSRFHPDQDHRKLACSACHLPFPVDDGTTAIRYKPLGTACNDCHDARGGRR